MRYSRFCALTVALAMIVSIVRVVDAPPARAEGLSVDRGLLTSPVSEVPIAATPNILGVEAGSPGSFNGEDKYARGIAVVGSKVVVGGKFEQVANPGSTSPISRVNVFAYNRATGQIDSAFAPTVDGVVNQVIAHPNGQSVFLLGDFRTVNGQNRYGLALLNVSNGQLVPGFTGNVEGPIRDGALHGNTLYLGGSFWRINGQSRSGFGAIDVDTGAVRSINVSLDAPRQGHLAWIDSLDVSPDGTSLVFVGNFLTVAGQPREQVAMIDLSTGNLANWTAPVYSDSCNRNAFWSYVYDVEFDPTGVYFAIASTGGPFPGQICDSTARWEAPHRGSVDPTWVNWSGGDTLTAIAVTSAGVYVGGHQRWMNNHDGRDTARIGSVNRPGIALLDPSNGVPMQWNPGRPRGFRVWTIVGVPEGIFVGHDTDAIGGLTRRKIAFLPATDAVVPAPTPVELPALFVRGNGSGGYAAFQASEEGEFTAAGSFPLSVPGATGATVEAGTFYYRNSVSRLMGRSFDGSNIGPEVDLTAGVYTSTSNIPLLSSVTDFTWDNGRLWMARSNTSGLAYRGMSLESNILESRLITVATPGLTWNTTVGMEIVGDYLYRVRSNGNGNLYRIPLVNGVPTGPEEIVSGPGVDGLNWGTASGLFAITEEDLPPSVVVTSPEEGETVEGVIDITADATDDDEVVSVEFAIGDQTIGTDTDGTDGWSIEYDTTAIANGVHTITATATDTADQTATHTIDITVDNEGAPVMVFSGEVDSTNTAAPRWVSSLYTPTAGGTHTLTLDWADPADLHFDIRVASTNEWIGANQTSTQPKTINADLTANTTYRIAVWANTGHTQFTITDGAVVENGEGTDTDEAGTPSDPESPEPEAHRGSGPSLI